MPESYVRCLRDEGVKSYSDIRSYDRGPSKCMSHKTEEYQLLKEISYASSCRSISGVLMIARRTTIAANTLIYSLSVSPHYHGWRHMCPVVLGRGPQPLGFRGMASGHGSLFAPKALITRYEEQVNGSADSHSNPVLLVRSIRPGPEEQKKILRRSRPRTRGE